jgi:phosphatidylglycerol:prolipoprotein diacylglycerol transferase
MFVHPGFDPIAVSLGPLAVRWYGLMYIVGFALVWWFGRLRIKANPNGLWKQQDLDDVMFYGILGVILGGRIGYVLFYKLGDYINVPWKIFYVWEGGMSFHGGTKGAMKSVTSSQCCFRLLANHASATITPSMPP